MSNNIDSKQNQPVVTAVASYGMAGEVFHCPVLDDHPGFRMKTIMERTQNRSTERYPYVKISRTYEEILEDIEVELVVVNTPNELHYPMAKAALEAGKHVVVEKPFTITSGDGTELILLAQKKGLVLSVFQSKRFETDTRTLKKLLKEGLVGEPVELFLHYDRYRSNVTHKKWKEENNPGAGILYDLGVHLVDSVTHLFGLPENITCNYRILREGAGAPDYFNLRLGYSDLDVYLHSSTFVLQKGPVITLHGKKGSYLKYSNDPQEEQLKNGMKPTDEGYGKEKEENYGTLYYLDETEKIEKIYKSEPGNYADFYDGIFNAVRNKKPIPVSPEQALHNIRIIEHAIRSNLEHRTLKYEY